MWEKFAHIIETIDTEPGALVRAARWVRDKGYKSPLVVMDKNTRAVAGGTLLSALSGLDAREYIFPDELLSADEFAVGRLTAAYSPERDLIVAVGSGTIGDLCKFVAARIDRPVAVVGTAPSMDGYASGGSAMTLQKLKVTPQTKLPRAIFCDPDILKDAPMNMIAAGLGDILGKITSMADWKLAHMLNGERYDEGVASLIETALQKCLDGAPLVKSRSPEAIQGITEALIMSGIAMSLYGDSRPASGTEHHMSHYWELRYLMEGKPPILHGTKVGVAAVCALTMWQWLPDIPSPPAKSGRAAILLRVREMYGASAEDIIKTENPDPPFERILENWPNILELARSLPRAREIAAVLESLGAPSSPSGIGLDAVTLKDGVVLSRERKKTYTLLQLLGGLGLLEGFADRLAGEFFNL